jgi:hypothetical protein
MKEGMNGFETTTFLMFQKQEVVQKEYPASSFTSLLSLRLGLCPYDSGDTYQIPYLFGQMLSHA